MKSLLELQMARLDKAFDATIENQPAYRAELSRLIDLNPQEILPHKEFYESLAAEGKQKEAAAHCRQYASRYPNNMDLQMLYLFSMLQAGEYDAMQMTAKRILRESGDRLSENHINALKGYADPYQASGIRNEY